MPLDFQRNIRPSRQRATGEVPSFVNFSPMNGVGVTWLYPPWLCQQMIEEILVAMSKAMATGVVEYRIGSRQLRRYSLKELQDLLGFWNNMLDASMYGSSIIAKRGAPTDT